MFPDAMIFLVQFKITKLDNFKFVIAFLILSTFWLWNVAHMNSFKLLVVRFFILNDAHHCCQVFSRYVPIIFVAVMYVVDVVSIFRVLFSI